MPWAALGASLDPSVCESIMEESHVAGPAWLAPNSGAVRPSEMMDLIVSAPETELKARAVSGIWTGPHETKAEVSARIRQRSEALARRLRAVRSMFHGHLQHGDPTSFVPAVLATSSAGESESGDPDATAGRPSVFSAYGTKEDLAHLVIAPRTRDANSSGTELSSEKFRRQLLRQESSWGLSKVAKAMAGLRGWSAATATPPDNSAEQGDNDTPPDIISDAGQRQSNLLKTMMKEQKWGEGGTGASKRDTSPEGGNRTKRGQLWGQGIGLQVVHRGEHEGEEGEEFDGDYHGVSVTHQRGSKGKAGAGDAGNGDPPREGEGLRSVPKAEAPIVFDSWVPVSQYHACVASDELLPLYRCSVASPPKPAIIHVQSPVPDFKRLNHSVIASRDTCDAPDEDLQNVLEAAESVRRPGTCSAVLQTTPHKAAAQGPEEEPTFATLLQDNVCDSIQEEGPGTRQGHGSVERAPHVVGVCKTTQHQRPRTQPLRPASRQAWQRGCLGTEYAARFTPPQRTPHSRTPTPGHTGAASAAPPSPLGPRHSRPQSRLRPRSRSQSHSPPHSPAYSPPQSRSHSPGSHPPDACMPGLFARPVHGEQDRDAQLLLAAWHHHRHQGAEPLRKALGSSWDWGWANSNRNILDKFQDIESAACTANLTHNAEAANVGPFGDIQPPRTSPESLGNVMRARPLKQQSRRTAQVRSFRASSDTGAGDALALDMRSKPSDQQLFEDVAMKLLARVSPTDGAPVASGANEGLVASLSEDALTGPPQMDKLRPAVNAGKLKAGTGALAKVGRRKKSQGPEGGPASGDAFGTGGCEVLFGINLRARIDGRYT